jgi:hypothetical protein
MWSHNQTASASFWDDVIAGVGVGTGGGLERLPHNHTVTVELVDFCGARVGTAAQHSFQTPPLASPGLDDSTESAALIPNTVHFIFGLKPDFGGKPFSLVHYLSIKSAHDVQRPSFIFVHYIHTPTGYWWEQARQYITPRPVNESAIARVRSSTPLVTAAEWERMHVAHRADILRLLLLIDEGGIYLDLDVVFVAPLPLQTWSSLGSRSTTLALEGSDGLGNAVMVAKPGAAFLQRWLALYKKSFRGGDAGTDDIHRNDAGVKSTVRNSTQHPSSSTWADFSVKLPKVLAMQHPAEVHVLPDRKAFHSPGWGDPAIRKLWHDTDYDFRGHYVVHLFESLTWTRWLQHLRSSDVWLGNSSILNHMRQFLPVRALPTPPSPPLSYPAPAPLTPPPAPLPYLKPGPCLFRALLHGGQNPEAGPPHTEGSENGRLDVEVCTYLLTSHFARYGCTLVVSTAHQYPPSYPPQPLSFLGAGMDGTGFHIHILAGGARLTDQYVRPVSSLLPPFSAPRNPSSPSVFVCGAGLNDFGQLVRNVEVLETVKKGKFHQIRFQTGATFEARLARLGVHGYGTLQGSITGKVLNHIIHLQSDILETSENASAITTPTGGSGGGDGAKKKKKIKSNLFQHGGPSALLAREYLLPVQGSGWLEDIPAVLASIGRAAALSSYGLDNGWLTTANPFANIPTDSLPPVVTLHYERPAALGDTNLLSHNEVVAKMLSAIAAVVAKVSKDCLVILFTTDYDPVALVDLHAIAMAATEQQVEEREARAGDDGCWHGGFLTVSNRGVDFRFALRLLAARQTVANLVVSRSLLGTSLSIAAEVPSVCVASDFGTFELTELVAVEERYVFHVGEHHDPLQADKVYQSLQHLVHSAEIQSRVHGDHYADVDAAGSSDAADHDRNKHRFTSKADAFEGNTTKDAMVLSCTVQHKLLGKWLSAAKLEFATNATGHQKDWMAAKQRLSLASRRARTYHHEAAENLVLGMLGT